MPKTAHSLTEQFSWREDDLISLLVWSEICGKHGINFSETFEAYIHDVQNSSGQVVSAITRAQARYKLRDLRKRVDTTTYTIRESSTNRRFIPAVEIQKKVTEGVTKFESDLENKIAKLKGQYTVSDHGKSTPQRMGGSSRQGVSQVSILLHVKPVLPLILHRKVQNSEGADQTLPGPLKDNICDPHLRAIPKSRL